MTGLEAWPQCLGLARHRAAIDAKLGVANRTAAGGHRPVQQLRRGDETVASSDEYP